VEEQGPHQGYTNDDRIMHSVIKTPEGKPELKFWLQTGTKDETADRNKNGIIDSIDDTIDVIKELLAKGYQRPADIQYLEVLGGTHDTETWGKAMPKFFELGVWEVGIFDLISLFQHLHHVIAYGAIPV
jgi:enterochelin esterase family protein